ncbi:hypothetical protein BJ742DRAFT_814555 [Cladochytrium replicatum]|nr:hypothetical protein BJ742DRAFT_814555 [Cladochytrium replicatum]
MDRRVIGVLGGGQLGRMMVEAANRLNLTVAVLDSESNPAAELQRSAPHVAGSFRDRSAILELASRCDILTAEIEHVDCDSLDSALSSNTARGLRVFPSPATIRIIQDKFVQKSYFAERGIPVSEFREVTEGREGESVKEIAAVFGYPLMLKTRTLAYDGRGNRVVKNEADVEAAIEELVKAPPGASAAKPKLYAEKWVTYDQELAVMVVRSANTAGETASYPTVQTIQRNNICWVVIAPAQIDGLLAEKAQKVAEDAVRALPDGAAGIFGVELFLVRKRASEGGDEILLNEIAPRPHNSGHYTQEGAETSQFEQHLRAITGMPLGGTQLKTPFAGMVNILGKADSRPGLKPNEVDEALEETLRPCKVALTLPGTTVHLYGKRDCRKGRKMGHINVVANSSSEGFARIDTLLHAIVDDSDTSSSSPGPILSTKRAPLVAIIMGSDSDLPVMSPAAQILKEFDVPFELTIVSAHRTPERMFAYAKTAHQRGLKVIIAGAGGAAHLPGMTAAITPLPVIGVPVALKHLDGVDSLHSIIQMPRGFPVATVAINNSTNAALLAVRILGSSVPFYLEKMIAYAKKQEAEVLVKAERLESVGWSEYALQK